MKFTNILVISLVTSQRDVITSSDAGSKEVNAKSTIKRIMTKNISFRLNRKFKPGIKLSCKIEKGITETRIPTALVFEDLVFKAQNEINLTEMTNFITNFSSFHNRYYNSDFGKKSAEFLYDQIKNSGVLFSSNFTTEYFNHSWKQPSIIARSEGTEEPDQLIIVGAHMDSINELDPMNGKAPGADDDGSGVTSILGAIKSLEKIKFIPKRTIEFHFYAGEEVGFVGSSAIARNYKKDNKQIVGMLMIEMTGMNENDRVKVMTDYTDPDLNNFLKKIITKYTKYTPFESKCKYPCSDHFSFFKTGYPTSVSTTEFLNSKLHTPEDTMKFIDMKNVAEFSKLILGFLIELAEPSAVLNP